MNLMIMIEITLMAHRHVTYDYINKAEQYGILKLVSSLNNP
jgi:hypothetical protein